MNHLKLLLLTGGLAALFLAGLSLPTVRAGEPVPTLIEAKPLTVDASGDGLRLRQRAGLVTIATAGGTTRLPLDPLDGVLRLPLETGSISLRLTPAGRLDLEARYDETGRRLVIETGGDLDLAGAALDGSLVIASRGSVTVNSGRLAVGGDLTLAADQKLSLRDSPARPLLVSAGGNLGLHAGRAIDIVALDHSDSGLFSGGDMRLAAPSPVRGDVHYFSGGAFAIEQPDGQPGHLLSPEDPIVFANGDVALGDYSGASLHVLAGGSVSLGNVEITGPDTGPNSVNPGNSSTFNGVDTIAALAAIRLPNSAISLINGAITPTLDIRAGIDWTTFAGGAPGNQIIPGGLTPTFGATTSAAITVTGAISISAPAGQVFLTNRYRPNNLSGNITTGDINAGTIQPQTNGGSIAIDSRGDILVGGLSTAADVAGQQVTAGDAGNIELLALNGEIVSSGNLSAFARTPGNSSGPAGNGGFIVARAANGISIGNGTGQVSTFASSNDEGSAGNGGDVSFATTGGNMNIGSINSYAFGLDGPVGNGGDIFLQADGGAVALSNSFFTSINASSIGQLPGNGGTVTIVANGDLTTAAGIRTNVGGPTGNGGEINLFSTIGNIATGDLFAQAASSGVPGNGGNVIVEAPAGGITTGDVSGFSNAFVINNDARDGGDILMTALGDIDTGGLENYAEARGAQGDAGRGGIISLESQAGSITGRGDLLAFSRSALNNQASSAAQDGGDVVLQAANSISVSGRIDAMSESAVFGSGVVSATATTGGTIALTATAGSITSGGNLNSYASADLDAGDGGPVSLSAATGIQINNGSGLINSFSRSEKGSVGNGGPVTVSTAASDILLGAVDSRASNTFANAPTGSGGDINLMTNGGRIDLSGGSFFTLQSNASGSGLIGNSGDISLSATQGIAVDSGITAQALGIDGNGGDIQLLTTGGDIGVSGPVNASAVKNNSTPGSAGNIIIQTLQGNITTEDILARSLALLINNDSRNGGAVSLQAPNGTIATGLIESYSEARGLDGDTGDGGPVEMTAAGNITIGGHVETYALASINNNNSGSAGNGGTILLQTNGALVITDALRTFSAATGPNGQAAAAGDVNLSAGGDIELTAIDARAPDFAASGPGGTVEITTGQFLRATGNIGNRLFNFPSEATISTVGLPNSSAITITHGGGGLIPFVVGDDATNGTLDRLETAGAVIDPTQSFLFDHFEAPNIWILSVPVPELAVTKAADPAVDAPYRGQISYTVTLRNLGLAPAGGVLFTDTLPVEVTFDRFIAEPGGSAVFAGPPEEIRWSGSIPANDAAVFRYVVNHTGDYGDVFSNTAAFLYPTAGQSGSASAAVAVAGPPALTISKRAVPDTDVTYRGEVSYTVVLTNSGPSPAENTRLTDTLPVSTTFDRWVIQPVGATVTNDELTWSGTVPASGGLTFSFVVSHTGDYEDLITNTVRYAHATGSGSAEATFTVEPWVADLLISKSSVRDEAAGRIFYTIVAQNLGPGDGSGSMVVDPLPAGISDFVWQCTPTGGAICTPTGSGPLDDTLVSFPPGSQATYLITATMINTAATIINEATIVPAPGLLDTAPENSAIDISRPFGRIYMPVLLRNEH